MKSKSVGVVTSKFVITEDIKPQESLQQIAQNNSVNLHASKSFEMT